MNTYTVEKRILDIVDALTFTIGATTFQIIALSEQPQKLDVPDNIYTWCTFEDSPRERDYTRALSAYELTFTLSVATGTIEAMRDTYKRRLATAVATIIDAIQSRPRLEHPTTDEPLDGAGYSYATGDGAHVENAPIQMPGPYGYLQVDLSVIVPYYNRS